MKRMQGWFWSLRLNRKFTVMCLTFVTIPMAVLSVWMFWSMEDNLIREKSNAMTYKLDMAGAQAAKNVDSINMSTQFFLSDQDLKDFLAAYKSGHTFSTKELLTFHSQVIASLERMINNNSYLYQARVYVDSEDIPEMMPIIYRKERMKKLSFYEDDLTYGWKFGYQDNLFFSYGQLTEKREILSLLTPMASYGHDEMGILEISTYMDTMFPVVYESTQKLWGCFVDKEGKLHFAEGFDEPFRREVVEEVLAKDVPGGETTHVFFYEGGGRRLILGGQKFGDLGGTLVYVEDIQDDLDQIDSQKTTFIVVGLLAVILLGLAVNRVVQVMLRQFYSILRSVREVQSGDLDVVIEDFGGSEMGELGDQINKMLQSIKQLTTDNLNHELLVKNTEIRALQNQINAHFIYNVLESIKMMAEIEEDYDISDAITSLGKLLRYSMKWVSGNVTVAEELEYIQNYLKLINLRLDYEIYLSLNIPKIILRQEIPKMSLQPIVENAIYHGIEQMATDTNIYIKGIVDGDDCVIELTDAGKGMDEEQVAALYKRINGELEVSGGEGTGIGLKNVQDRIKINFGEKYGLAIASKLGCYTKIMVRIPMQQEAEAES